MAQALREPDAADVRRLRHLEQESARLKKLVAERELKIEVMEEISNEDRPHSSLEYLAPLEFKQKISSTNPKATVLCQAIVVDAETPRQDRRNVCALKSTYS